MAESLKGLRINPDVPELVSAAVVATVRPFEAETTHRRMSGNVLPGGGDLDVRMIVTPPVVGDEGNSLVNIVSRAGDFTEALRGTFPGLRGLYPEVASDSLLDTHFQLPGLERIAAARQNLLMPLGANTFPVAIVEGDRPTAEAVTEATAKGLLVVPSGKESPDAMMQSLSERLVWAVARPEITMRVLQEIATQTLALKSEEPKIAEMVMQSIAFSLDRSASSIINDRYNLWLDAGDLEVLGRVARLSGNSLSHGRCIGPGQRQVVLDGEIRAKSFVHAQLRNFGFEVDVNRDLLGQTTRKLPHGRRVSFVDHIRRGEYSEDHLVVPREQELLISYIPSLIEHLARRPLTVDTPHRSRRAQKVLHSLGLVRSSTSRAA